MAGVKSKFIVQKPGDSESQWIDTEIGVTDQPPKSKADCIKAIRAEGTAGMYRIVAVKGIVTAKVENTPKVTLT